MPERGKSRRQISLLLLRSQCIRSVLMMDLEGRRRAAGEGRLGVLSLLDWPVCCRQGLAKGWLLAAQLHSCSVPGVIVSVSMDTTFYQQPKQQYTEWISLKKLYNSQSKFGCVRRLKVFFLQVIPWKAKSSELQNYAMAKCRNWSNFWEQCCTSKWMV